VGRGAFQTIGGQVQVGDKIHNNVSLSFLVDTVKSCYNAEIQIHESGPHYKQGML